MKRIHLILVLTCLTFFSCSDNNSQSELLTGNSITSFKVVNDDVEYSISINGTNISVVEPYNTSSSLNLSLDVLISEGASISPNPKNVTSIENPITFTITAENGDQQSYTVTLSKQLSPENSILGVVLNHEDNQTNADVDEENNLVSTELTPDWDLTNITAQITISDLATIEPSPDTVTDYSNPVTYVVTAQDGSSKEYEVILTRQPFEGNDILFFTIRNNTLNIPAEVDQQNGTITQRVSPSMDLTQLSIDYQVSDKAVINPDPSSIMDYSQPVVFTVTSESNEEKMYQVMFQPMQESVNFNCNVQNASKWFGGDNRANKINPDWFFAPRNVGTGQGLIPEYDLLISTYSIRFSGYFEYVDDDGNIKTYFGNTTIRLQLRDSEGNIIASKDNTFTNPMALYWITFDLSDLNLILKKDNLYYFTWYLVDGESLGIFTGTHGNTESHSGFCNGPGLSGQSRIREETHLDDWDTWGLHSWHFNFRLSGMK